MKSPHSRTHSFELAWPIPPLNVALIEPEIPPNTGNIARLCAATGTRLHLVGKLGFRLTSAQLRRAGLDYWDSVDMVRHGSFPEFSAAVSPARCFFFSTAGRRLYTDARYQPGDVLVFGSESRGLPDDILAAHEADVLGIPMQTDRVRSLNLATAVAVVLYEALRQVNAGR